jgi:hypothetical protein
MFFALFWHGMGHAGAQDRPVSVSWLRFVPRSMLAENVAKISSPTGNRTRAFHVTGGDPHH